MPDGLLSRFSLRLSPVIEDPTFPDECGDEEDGDDDDEADAVGDDELPELDIGEEENESTALMALSLILETKSIVFSAVSLMTPKMVLGFPSPVLAVLVLTLLMVSDTFLETVSAMDSLPFARGVESLSKLLWLLGDEDC